MGKSALVCVEAHIEAARPALEWTLSHLLDEDDELHMVTVLPPQVYSAAPVAPVATAGAVSAVTSAWDAQRQRDGLVAEDTLKEAIEVVNGMGIKLRAVHTHALPASGGASGIGATIAEYATSRGVDVAVVGSRGLGAFKRSLMSVVGLGSVSDYCTHHLHCPVLVVRQGCLETLSVAQPDPEHPSADKRKIAVALDNSSHSMAMFEWALNNLIRETDILHVISVASNVNMHVPLMEGASPQLTAAEVDAWKASKKEALKSAEDIAKKAVDLVGAHGIPLDHVWYKGLLPEGGASGFGEAICHYVKHNHANLLVMGNRGQGDFERAMSAVVGLGSVSDYAVHNAPCPVMVFKN